ncbi:MAG: exodeoxyribonuclease VII large subunit [Endomicrobiaceae bacterium]
MVDLFDFESSNNNNDDGKKIYSVSEINNEIKIILEDSYPVVWISGEISNFKTYSSGHMYFNLKDENSQISAVMFSGYNQKLNFIPKDGIQILVFGKITSYVQRGTYQIQVSYAKEIGIGSLQEMFEKLKNKLETEGLFDHKYKKQIPYIVNKVGIITSKDGAALHDILSVLDRRFSNIEVLIYSVRVQGNEAKYEIAKAVEYLNANYKDLDVLLVGRGGGSLEDLWAFNEEIVARAVFNSKIPVISCVGHEVDFTITDFVSDLRAATPSVAAEMVAKNRIDIEDKLTMLKKAITEKIANIIFLAEEKINKFKTCRALSKPYLIYEDKMMYIDELKDKLVNSIKKVYEDKKSSLQTEIQKLNLLSPLNILQRGYSVCFDEKGSLIKKSEQLLKDDTVNLKFSDGTVKAKVL